MIAQACLARGPLATFVQPLRHCSRSRRETIVNDTHIHNLHNPATSCHGCWHSATPFLAQVAWNDWTRETALAEGSLISSLAQGRAHQIPAQLAKHLDRLLRKTRRQKGTQTRSCHPPRSCTPPRTAALQPTLPVAR